MQPVKKKKFQNLAHTYISQHTIIIYKLQKKNPSHNFKKELHLQQYIYVYAISSAMYKQHTFAFMNNCNKYGHRQLS